jgi:murein DD-endopeptidase MepM/ murein hydrolase activator NlpD
MSNAHSTLGWTELRAGTGVGTAPARPGDAATAGDREKIAALAREFEAFFIFQMVRQMRQSMLDDESGQGLGAGTMTDTMDVELGRQLASSGGIGLAQILQTAIERQVGVSGATAAGRYEAAGKLVEPMSPSAGHPAAQRLAAPAPMAYSAAATGAPSSGDAALPLPVAAPLSSGFGWRGDPFHGANRFHAGVDIAAAYGRQVPAVEAGQVVFAGVQGGYGNTVLIEHPGGIQTRYAHLSSLDVEAGEQVAAGTVIGRVGSSGRSTGAHLHFEVLQAGQPVDPQAAAMRFGERLKVRGRDADLPLEQPSALERP